MNKKIDQVGENPDWNNEYLMAPSTKSLMRMVTVDCSQPSKLTGIMGLLKNMAPHCSNCRRSTAAMHFSSQREQRGGS
jgi:hypothetical protein